MYIYIYVKQATMTKQSNSQGTKQALPSKGRSAQQASYYEELLDKSVQPNKQATMNNQVFMTKQSNS